MIDFDHFKSQFFLSRKLQKNQSLTIHSFDAEIRKYWIKAKMFVHEHGGYSPEEVDRLEIVDFLILLNECENIADAKRRAMEA